MDNGVLRIHPLDGSNNFEHFSSFWALNIHDNHHGGIRHIKTSFDDKYVFTAGLDGNFFVFRFMDSAVKGLKVPHKVSIPSAKVSWAEPRMNIQSFIFAMFDQQSGFSAHYAGEIWKRSFVSTVGPLVHTNPSRKRCYSFISSALQTRGIWKRRLCVITQTENILKTKTLVFFIRTSNFGAEAECSYIVWGSEAEKVLKMFLNLYGIQYFNESVNAERI